MSGCEDIFVVDYQRNGGNHYADTFQLQRADSQGGDYRNAPTQKTTGGTCDRMTSGISATALFRIPSNSEGKWFRIKGKTCNQNASKCSDWSGFSNNVKVPKPTELPPTGTPTPTPTPGCLNIGAGDFPIVKPSGSDALDPVIHVGLLPSIVKGNCVNMEAHLEHARDLSYEVTLTANSKLSFDKGCSDRHGTVTGHSDSKDKIFRVQVFACSIGQGTITATLRAEREGEAPASSTAEATMNIGLHEIELTKGMENLCRYVPFGLVSKWNVVATSHSGNVQIHQGLYSSGAYFNVREYETCVKARFLVMNRNTQEVVVDRIVHIVPKHLDEQQFDVNRISAMSPREFSNWYVSEAPGPNKSAQKDQTATTLRCSLCVGFTETKAVPISLKHLKKPVIYAYGKSGNGNRNPLSEAAQWTSPFKGLPEICKLSPSSNSSNFSTAWVDLFLWLTRELLVEPVVCQTQYKDEFKTELLEDLSDPELADKTADELIGITFPWEAP